MRRENRRNVNLPKDDMTMKIIKYAGIGVGILAVIVFGLLLYSRNLNEEVKKGSLSSEQIASIMNNTVSENESKSASTEMGKSVNEASNEIKSNKASNETNEAQNLLTTNETTNTNKTQNTTTNTTKSNTNTTKSTTQNTTKPTNAGNEKTEKAKELTFVKPVEGDIVREFAKDNLIYSNTLEEWTTHMGIDIKAEKTTVVKAAEAGTVKSIKNDPRYGLTIVVEHENGYQSVYANLLTSEFVVEGEKVEKEQSLGTVGNTAVFEVADEPHLHFEIWKDGVQVDPTTCLK